MGLGAGARIKRRTGRELRAIRRELGLHAMILFGLLAVFWGLEIADQLLFSGALDGFGLRPRTGSGLLGIFTAPFLHGGFFHLIANTVPFLVLGWLIMLRDVRQWALASLSAVVLGGLGVWLFGREAVHIGASGVIFGYLGFLLSIGLFERKIGAILLSLFVGLTYGTLIFGALPFFSPVQVSWEGHLFGLLGGVVAAALVGRAERSRRGRPPQLFS